MKKLVLFGAVALVAFSSCDKIGNPIEDAAETAEAVESYSNAQNAANDIMNLAMDVASNDSRLQKKSNFDHFPSLAQITWVDSLFTDGDGVDFTLDMGELLERTEDVPDALKGNDGKRYAGMLRCELNKPIEEVGAVLTVALANTSAEGWLYMDDGIAGVNGTWIKGHANASWGIGPLIRVEKTASNELDIRIAINIVKIDAEGNYDDSWIWGDYKMVQTKGSSTGSDIEDDVYELNGFYEGETEGAVYTIVIDEPLVRKMQKNCSDIFVKGRLTFKSAADAIIDYGDGSCDNKVKITVKGVEKEYTF